MKANGKERTKGLVFGASMLIPGIFLSMLKGRMWLFLIAFAILVMILAAVRPRSLNPAFRALGAVGAFLKSVFAFVAFYAVVTPMSWFLRILSRSYRFPLSPSAKRSSYWKSDETALHGSIDFNKQF